MTVGLHFIALTQNNVVMKADQCIHPIISLVHSLFLSTYMWRPVYMHVHQNEANLKMSNIWLREIGHSTLRVPLKILCVLHRFDPCAILTAIFVRCRSFILVQITIHIARQADSTVSSDAYAEARSAHGASYCRERGGLALPLCTYGGKITS